MGSGKSTVGRALANKIGYQFLDSDREIEARCGVDIPTIFDYEGEAGFRDRESRMINELTKRPGTSFFCRSISKNNSEESPLIQIVHFCKQTTLRLDSRR
jgi:hypothetical protein